MRSLPAVETLRRMWMQQFMVVVGIGKTHLQRLAMAAAINLKRVSGWLAGGDREKMRRSAFARVMQPLTA
jgi:hypothetical protein